MSDAKKISLKKAPRRRGLSSGVKKPPAGYENVPFGKWKGEPQLKNAQKGGARERNGAAVKRSAVPCPAVAPKKPRAKKPLHVLFAEWRCDHPPVKALSGLIEAGTLKHADLLTDDGWNLDYCVEVSLTVRELRVIAEFVEALKKVVGGGR